MTNTQAVPGKISGPPLRGGPCDLSCPLLPVTSGHTAKLPEEQGVAWPFGLYHQNLGQVTQPLRED